MLLLSDPAVSAVPVHDCGEELVDLRDVPELLLDKRKQDSEGSWARLRVGVLERLLRAQHALRGGLRLLIIEGHRPAALQQHYFDEHRAKLTRSHSDHSSASLDSDASKHISPPSVAPHPCGAAVDLTLARDTSELDLGTPVNATPEQSDGACFTAAENISAEARTNRDVLTSALGRVGLVNYPPEWWHFSYGDRYWAAVTGSAFAFYGPR